MSSFECARTGCAAIICLTAETEAARREDHRTFFCPNGHTNYFPNATATERRIKELEEQNARLRREAINEERWWQEVKSDLLQCQWPGCRMHSYPDVTGLRRHMRRVHGMPTDKEWEAALDVRYNDRSQTFEGPGDTMEHL